MIEAPIVMQPKSCMFSFNLYSLMIKLRLVLVTTCELKLLRIKKLWYYYIRYTLIHHLLEEYKMFNRADKIKFQNFLILLLASTGLSSCFSPNNYIRDWKSNETSAAACQIGNGDILGYGDVLGLSLSPPCRIEAQKLVSPDSIYYQIVLILESNDNGVYLKLAHHSQDSFYLKADSAEFQFPLVDSWSEDLSSTSLSGTYHLNKLMTYYIYYISKNDFRILSSASKLSSKESIVRLDYILSHSLSFETTCFWTFDHGPEIFKYFLQKYMINVR